MKFGVLRSDNEQSAEGLSPTSGRDSNQLSEDHSENEKVSSSKKSWRQIKYSYKRLTGVEVGMDA